MQASSSGQPSRGIEASSSGQPSCGIEASSSGQPSRGIEASSSGQPSCGIEASSSERPSSKNKQRFLAPLLLALLTGLAYVNAAPKRLVYDDLSIISQNREFGGVETIPRLFFRHAWYGTGNASRLYRPLAMATLALDRTLYRGHARGYHVSSILYHIAATLLVFLLLLRLGLPRRAAFMAALVFGIHPIHTDAVDSVFNRSEILATLAVVGSLVLLLGQPDAARRLQPSVLAGATALYLAGLLCRESAVTLPVVGGLALVLFAPRPTLRDELRRLAPLAILGVPLMAYLLLRQLALPGAGGGVFASLAESVGTASGRLERLALVATAARDYLVLMVVPYPLRASYADYTAFAPMAAMLMHLGLGTLAVLLRHRAPHVTFGIAFYYITLLPSTKLFADPTPFAERFAYLPSVGIVVLLGVLFAALERRAGSRALSLLGVALSFALMPLTLVRNLEWSHPLLLWEAEVRVSPTDWRALLNLSDACVANAMYIEAIELSELGSQLAPNHPSFHTNRGVALVKLARYAEAEEAFKRALALEAHTVNFTNLAQLYAVMGRKEDALRVYQAAIAAEKDKATWYALRGQMFLYALGDPAAAEQEFRKALEIEPRLAMARSGLAVARALREKQRPSALSSASSTHSAHRNHESEPGREPAAAPPPASLPTSAPAVRPRHSQMHFVTARE